MHDRVVTLTVKTEPVPHVATEERAAVRYLGDGISDVSLRYGFMEDPDVPQGLREAQQKGLVVDDDLTYFLGRETLLVTRKPGMALWRERLFVLMSRNAVRAVTFFRLPPERVVELGIQLEL
jgi:KUP system potassium uptake protein